MAVNIPDTAIEQPRQDQGLTESGERVYSRSFKDSYAALEECLNDINTGDKFGGYAVKSANLSRSPADTGILTINLVPWDVVTEGEDEQEDQIALDETWSIKAARNDKSLLAYCGTSEDSNPNRADIEAWLKEPDASVANNMQYRNPDGTLKDLNAASQALVAKFLAGHDSVMRFYPILTKKRTYSTEPASVYENLACIDTPTVSSIYTPPDEDDEDPQSPTPGTRAKKVKAPGNISSIISAHQWLKCQDDCDQTQDGKFVRIESWIGAKNGEAHWDENFYGTTNRWPMPYTTAS